MKRAKEGTDLSLLQGGDSVQQRWHRRLDRRGRIVHGCTRESKVDVIAKGDKSIRSCDCSISRIMKLRWPGVAQIEENLGAAMSIHMILAPPISTTRGPYRPC